MENSMPEEENIIKDFRNRFRPEKDTKAIKDRIPRDIKKLFEHKKKKKTITNQ